MVPTALMNSGLPCCYSVQFILTLKHKITQFPKKLRYQGMERYGDRYNGIDLPVNKGV